MIREQKSREEFVIVGPTVGLRAKVLHKAVTTGISSSYNINYSGGSQRGQVVNVRWNASYILQKKHALSANTIWQKRAIDERPTNTSLTATLSYAYIFYFLIFAYKG